MSKKIIAILMAAAVSAAVLTSCGGEEVTSSKAAGASSVTTADVSSTEDTSSTESTVSTASIQSTVSNVSSGKGASSKPADKPASSIPPKASSVAPKPDNGGLKCDIVDLTSQFNKNSFTNPDYSGGGDFDGNKDGKGPSSYAAELVPSRDLSTFHKYLGEKGATVNFKLGVISGGQNNTIESRGQQLTLPNKKAQYICMVGASGQYGTKFEDCEYVVNYTDGSTTETVVGMKNWCELPEISCGTQKYRHHQDSTGVWSNEGFATYFGVYEIEVDPNKTLKSITMPEKGATHNIFAISLVY